MLGRVNTRTAERHADGFTPATVARRSRRSSTDRHGRELGKRNPEGRPYLVCPMCSKRSSVRYRANGARMWACESCGYHDDEHGPLN